jgi:hypothetical protein
MEVLQHHDSPWQLADIALSPINLLLDFTLPNFINHYTARPLMFTQQRNLGSNTMNSGIKKCNVIANQFAGRVVHHK